MRVKISSVRSHSFFLERREVKSFTCTLCFPTPFPPPLLPHARLLSLAPPLPHHPTHLYCCPGHCLQLRRTCRGVGWWWVIRQIWQRQCHILMEQSRGKPLLERMSREVTSSNPAPSRSLRAPEVGTETSGKGGGGNSLALTCGSHTHTHCEPDCWRRRIWSLDVTWTVSFPFINIKES